MTQFTIPPKPALKKRKTPPRKTQYAIMPLRALTDKRITDRNRTVLAMMSSFVHMLDTKERDDRNYYHGWNNSNGNLI